MATSKAWQAQQWWEADDLGSIRWVAQPAWLGRARRDLTRKPAKDDEQPLISNHLVAEAIAELIHPTPHAECRMAQRNLSTQEIGYTLLYGQLWHKAGAVLIHLRWKDIPAPQRAGQRRQQLHGATVVLDTEREDTILTAYRNRDSGLRHIKRKPDYSFH